ncbi:unnamed protein product, partial [Ectocarpus sp. 4 AP-2014]
TSPKQSHSINKWRRPQTLKHTPVYLPRQLPTAGRLRRATHSQGRHRSREPHAARHPAGRRRVRRMHASGLRLRSCPSAGRDASKDDGNSREHAS